MLNLVDMENKSDVWVFVEKYYPDYQSSFAIAENDDLQKIVDGEIGGEAEKIYNEIAEDLKPRFPYHSPEEREEYRVLIVEQAQNKLNESKSYIFEGAIESFIEEQDSLNKKAVTLFNLLVGVEFKNPVVQKQVETAAKELEQFLDFNLETK